MRENDRINNIFGNIKFLVGWHTDKCRYHTRSSKFCKICCFQLHQHSDHNSVYTREVHAIIDLLRSFFHASLVNWDFQTVSLYK